MAHPDDKPERETLEDLKTEYARVYGRCPRISRSGILFIIDYTPVRVTELREMLLALRASPDVRRNIP